VPVCAILPLHHLPLMGLDVKATRRLAVLIVNRVRVAYEVEVEVKY
jgi:hypothetical protein